MEISLVDPIEWARSHPEMFFGTDAVEPVHLLWYLLGDVIELGRGTCVVFQEGEWTVVGSDVDWLQHDQYAPEELFAHVVAEPKRGVHSMRGEILVGAFARHISLGLEGKLHRIVGELPPKQVQDRASQLHQAIFFSLPPP
ncbi:hypothetical protein [Mitsuaria sp. 7]|uniref:hypothetical protein n=1 Tax=Mitsuaria sp. 7 TaxID=1658665 RepID=UPI0007DDB2A5|nr:hypothetical protein [Mitsuaria sp. 7]ANH67337.1 hypothetical protein ABE85_06715 [Mitsuaria sp. 7]